MTGRDARAELDYAEFAGWMEAQGWHDGEAFDFGDLRDAFGAGMRAARDRGATSHPAELAAAMAETRRLRERIGRLLDMLGRGSAGYTLRLSGVTVAREYRDAGLPVPARLGHLEGQ